MKKAILLVLIFFLVACTQQSTEVSPEVIQKEGIKVSITPHEDKVPVSADEKPIIVASPKAQFKNVSTWFYLKSPTVGAEVENIVDSSYDLIVIDPVFTKKNTNTLSVRTAIDKIRKSSGANVTNKIVLAYLDITHADVNRYYWQSSWREMPPSFIIGDTTDTNQDVFLVAYWDKDWKKIWFGSYQDSDSLMKQIVDEGFDGVYLDGVQAYNDDSILERAYANVKDTKKELFSFIKEIKQSSPDLIIITQDAPELVRYDEYVAPLDGVAQEHVWFDGGISGKPNGDCRLPRTLGNITSRSYKDSLKGDCLDLYEDFPQSTLHTASEEYLLHLNLAQEKGLKVFTVDYAEKTSNKLTAYNESRSQGFIPFVSVKNLDVFVEPR